jgi:hypothetical protein
MFEKTPNLCQAYLRELAYFGSISEVSALWRLAYIAKYAPTARISARGAWIVSW